MAQQAFIEYRDQLILFPPVDDVEKMDVQRRVDSRVAFSSGGTPESVMLLPHEVVRVSVEDAVTTALIEDLQAWWSHARRGLPYTFGFDHDDQYITAMERDMAKGTDSVNVSSRAKLTLDHKYLLCHDLLGRNATFNLLDVDTAVCDTLTPYTFIGNAYGQVQAVAWKAGTATVKIITNTPLVGDGMTAVGPAVPLDGYLTFSVWVGNETHNAWRLRITGGSVDVTGPILVEAFGGYRMELTAFFPDGAASTTLKIENTVAGGGTKQIDVDALQAELTKHVTPWAPGDADEPSRTASTEGWCEILEVDYWWANLGDSQSLKFTTSSKFAYSKRDVLVSQKYWEKVINLDPASPLNLKEFTERFDHRFREVP